MATLGLGQQNALHCGTDNVFIQTVNKGQWMEKPDLLPALHRANKLTTTTNIILTSSQINNGKQLQAIATTTYGSTSISAKTSTENKLLDNIFSKQKLALKKLNQDFIKYYDSKKDATSEIPVQRDYDTKYVQNEMPAYKFPSLETDKVKGTNKGDMFLSVADELLLLESNKEKHEDHQKTLLVNEISASLIGGVDFKNYANERRKRILNIANAVAEFDPEFILKAALYSRQELNIRTTSNFLLAFASYNEKCRPFLRKYYCTAIRLPTDWIEVAELYTTLSGDKGKKLGSLPTVLRRAMTEKFPDFDTYQLGKYKKDSTKKPKKRKATVKTAQLHAESGNEDNDEEAVESKTFRLKYLIRMLHISDPAFHVMALIGKSYPENVEQFRTSRLEGTWEREKAGKRMKLPVPQTWETQLSMKGNNATTWEELIDSKKLPYMAMLRNIRNIILADVSKGHHRQILMRINNEQAVIHSRQLPFRFLAAHEVLDEIKKRLSESSNSSADKPKKIPASVSGKLLDKYHTALDGAISIAAIHNLPAVAGKTLFFKNVGDEMHNDCITSKGLGRSRSMKSVADLLCEMCTKACESCQVLEYTCTPGMYGGNSITQIWYDKLMEIIHRKIKINTLIVVTDADVNIYFLRFVSLYRLLVNNRLLFVTISLNGSQPSVASDDELDVKLVGFSDNILRFIAQRGHNSLLSYIDNIDTKYKLKKCPSLAIRCEESVTDDKLMSPFIRQPRWRTVRVFISSTFVDMHGERDLLVRYVFPELRERARRLFIDLFEVDLRWGITEEESSNQKMVEICLKEVSKCQLFVGILGERYGSIPLSYQVNDDSSLEWLQDYPAGASITELEIQHAALANPKLAKGRAFFYMRDPSFISNISSEAVNIFTEQDEVPKRKLNQLKSRIKNSGMEVYDKYPCEFGGCVDGKYIGSGLSTFGERIINNIWNAIKNLSGAMEDADKDSDNVTSNTTSELQRQRAHIEKVNWSFIGRSEFISDAVSLIKSKNEGFILIAGRQGCGKTFIMGRLFSILEDDNAFTYPMIPCFVDAIQHSGRALYIIHYLCHQLKTLTKLKRGTKVDDMDGPTLLNCYLNEISSCTSCLVIFIDGIELLNEVDQLFLLNSIPNPLPKGIVIVSSASVLTPLIRQIACKDHILLKVKPLLLKERTQIARDILSLHGKTLNENAFNNQLTALTYKRECSLPMYIQLACQILCEHAVFEQLDDRITSMDNTVIGLLLSCVDQAKKEFGKDLIDAFLVLLSISPEGLTKDSMHCVMSLYMQLDKFEIDLNTVFDNLKQQSLVLPRVVIERLVISLKAIVRSSPKGNSEVFVSGINPQLYDQVLNEACGSKSTVAKIQTRLYLIKSGILINLADPLFDKSWKGKNAKALSLIPHHLFESHSYNYLEDALCNFDFVTAKIEMGLVSELLEDYQIAYRREMRKFVNHLLMKKMGTFVVRHQHIFKTSPNLILQTALNYEDENIANLAHDSIMIKAMEGYDLGLYLKVHSPLQKSYCRQTLNCKKPIFCVVICPFTDNFAIGEDNVLKVYESATLKEINSFYGHVDAITSICYIGQDRVCSGSFDGDICLWDLVKNIRLASMSGHEKRVTGCLCDHTGLVIVSVSLDRTIRTWSARTGKHISTMNVSRSPINCLDLHPHSHMAVIGMWNNTIEIWDLLSCKYISNIEYLSSSVQSVKFSPDAKYIVSSMLDGSMSIWSYSMRAEVITLQNMPVIRAFAFSKSGDVLAAGDDCTIKKYPLCFNDAQCSWKSNNDSECTAVTLFNYDLVAAGYKDGCVDIFSCETGAIIKSYNVAKTPIRLLCRHEEHDGILVVSADLVQIISLTSGNKPNVKLQDSSDVMAVTSDLYGYTIVTGNARGYVYIYRDIDIEKNFLKCFCYWAAHEEAIVALAFGVNQNKDRFATASTDNLVKLWLTPIHNKCDRRGLRKKDWGREISSDAYQDQVLRSEHASNILSCNWINTDCGKTHLLILSYTDGYIVALNEASGKEQWCVFAHDAPVSHLYHCRFNNAILSCAIDGSYKIWAYSGVELMSIESTGASCIGAFAKAKINCPEENHCMHVGMRICKPSIQGIVIGRGTRNGELSIERLGIKEMGCMVGHSDSIVSLSVGARDNIVTCALDRNVKMWNTENMEPSKHHFTHIGEITVVTFNPRFDILLTADSNGEILVWKQLDSWTPVVKIKAHENAVKWASFLGPTWHFVTASFDTMKLWKYEGPLHSEPVNKDAFSVKFLNEDEQTGLCCDYNVATHAMFVGTRNGDILAYEIKINEKEPSRRDWIRRYCSVYTGDAEEPCHCIVSIKCLKGCNEIIYATVSGILGVGKILEKNAVEPYIHIDLQQDPTFCIKNSIPTALTVLSNSKNNRYFAVAFSDGLVMYASYSSKKPTDNTHTIELNKIATHVDGVSGLTYNSETRQLWSGGRDGKIKVWRNDCQARNIFQVAEHQCSASVTCMEIAGDTTFAGDILGHVYFVTPLN